MTRRHLMIALPVALGVACTIKDERGTDDDETGSPTAPTTPTARPDKIEFRVTGFIPQGIPPVTIRHVDAINGLSQVVGNLPYYASLDSTRDTVFVSLEASAIGTVSSAAFLQIQILVNGALFREASSSGFDPRVAVSGTIRRGQVGARAA